MTKRLVAETATPRAASNPPKYVPGTPDTHGHYAGVPRTPRDPSDPSQNPRGNGNSYISNLQDENDFEYYFRALSVRSRTCIPLALSRHIIFEKKNNKETKYIYMTYDIYTHICICVYTYIMHSTIHVIYIYIYICNICTVYNISYIYIYMCINIYMYTFICTYVYIYTYIYVYNIHNSGSAECVER